MKYTDLYANKDEDNKKLNLSSEDNGFYNVNLSVHKLYNSRYSYPSCLLKNEDKITGIKRRRCSISYNEGSHIYERYWKDSLNFNLNTSITKKKKPNIYNFEIYKWSPLKEKKLTSMKKINELRKSIDETINKSVSIRNEVELKLKKHRKKLDYIKNREKGLINNLNKSREHIENELNKSKLMTSNKNLSDTYVMSNLTQSDKYKIKNFNIDSQNTIKEGENVFMNSDLTISSLKYENELKKKKDMKEKNEENKEENKEEIHNEQNMCNSKYHDINDLYKNRVVNNNVYIKDMDSKENNEKKKMNLKKRHTTQVINNDNLYIRNKRFKENTYACKENEKKKKRRHSDILPHTNLNISIYEYIKKNNNKKDNLMINKYNDSIYNVKDENESNEEYLNNKSKMCNIYDKMKHYKSFVTKPNKKKIEYNEEISNSNSYKCIKYLNNQFLLNIMNGTNKKKTISLLHEMREDYITSKTIYNKFESYAKKIEEQPESELSLDCFFLFRHLGNIVEDEEFNRIKNMEKMKYCYLDIPYLKLKECMTHDGIKNTDEIDDTDEHQLVEQKLLENYYFEIDENKNNLVNENEYLQVSRMSINNNENQNEENEIIQQIKNENIIDSEKTIKLITAIEKEKQNEKDFINNILNKPDIKKIYTTTLTLNENFILSGNLFNINFSPRFGAIIYHLKCEDEKYYYRIIEVSQKMEQRIYDLIDVKKERHRKSNTEKLKVEKKFLLFSEADIKHGLCIPMSSGWKHYAYLGNRLNVLIFRKSKKNI